MKCQAFARAQRNFRLRLLDFVFAEKQLPATRRLANRLRRMRLGNRQQRDGIRRAPGAFARGANPLLNQIEVFGQTHAAIVNRKS